MKRQTLLSVLALAGLGLGATSASAAGFVTGSLSFDGGFDCDCFAPGDTSIVSMLTLIAQESPADTTGAFGDYAGTAGDNNTVTQIIDLSAAPPGLQPVYATFNGFEFFADAVSSIVRTPMVCSSGVCVDSLKFVISGTVKADGFMDTSFIGVWTGNGSCLGAAGTCTSQPTASWSASISSPARIPEPASLALLGLGLLGVAARSRGKVS